MYELSQSNDRQEQIVALKDFYKEGYEKYEGIVEYDNESSFFIIVNVTLHIPPT